MAHEDDVFAKQALEILERLGFGIALLSGPDPIAPSGAVPVFSSQQGTFPSKYLKLQTMMAGIINLESRLIYVPPWAARVPTERIALSARALSRLSDTEAATGLETALRTVSGYKAKRSSRTGLPRSRPRNHALEFQMRGNPDNY
ncbi:hypothetical protein KKH81_01775 [Patescibacteria group bacterium]|nr:hypothetical protein [Patescibacteria group bacterium]